jgi:hypothetical protein
MKIAARHLAFAFLSVSSLAACDDPATRVASAAPASGAQLQEFSRQWNDKVELSKAGPLLQKYCLNMSGTACAADTVDRLKQYGFNDGATGVDLAYAFIAMAADARDGSADQKSSDEDFVHSCYRVMLGREPDLEGSIHHVGGLKDKGEEARRALALAFLKSPEFNSQK